MVNVSVIIPCYNAEKTIKETIESVLAQTYQDIEIIVVDDGSTDHSKEIIESFGSKVLYFYQENGGQSAARNTAIHHSSGKYLAFLDSDDLWMPEKLEKQLALMQQEGVDWCYCDCEYFLDSTGKSIGNYSNLVHPPKTGLVAETLLMGNFIASPTPVVSKKIIEEAGNFNESFQFGEDWDEWIRIAMISPIVYQPEILTKHRIHENSVTYMKDPDIVFLNHISVIENLCQQYPVRLNQIKTKAMAYHASEFSKSHFLRGNFQRAKEMIHMAINWEDSKGRKLLLMLYSFPRFLLNWMLKIYQNIKGKG